jgi:hypothetical protein
LVLMFAPGALLEMQAHGSGFLCVQIAGGNRCMQGLKPGPFLTLVRHG